MQLYFAAKNNQTLASSLNQKEEEAPIAVDEKSSRLRQIVTAPVRGAKATPGVIKKTPQTTANAVKSTPGAVKATPKGVKNGFSAVKENYKTTFRERSLGRKILLVTTDLIGLVTLPLAVLPGPNFIAYISESARKFTGEVGKTIYHESGMKDRMTEKAIEEITEDAAPDQDAAYPVKNETASEV